MGGRAARTACSVGHVLCFAVSLFLAIAPAGAQQWPTRAIKVISPYAPGSASDTVSRVVLDEIAGLIGQPIVVEPRPGAGGIVGFTAVAKADPDGYTLVTSSSSMATTRVLHKTLSYDPVADFRHIVLIGTSPHVLVVPRQSGMKTVADLVAAAKANPATVTFASAGIGSSSHMAAERFRLAAGISVRHIPFSKGGLNEVMAGRIDFYFIPLAAAASTLDSETLTILAVSSPNRSAVLPTVPSVVEAGYPDAVFRFWNGVSAPANTPDEIVHKLHSVTQRALRVPRLQERLGRLGVEPTPMSVAEFGQFFKDDLAATIELAKNAEIRAAD